MFMVHTVLRYSKEELLALHFTTTSPPEFPPDTMVASELALPPVSTLPFDYEEIYEQWKLNRNRGRGRGRGTTTGGEQTGRSDGQQQSDRSRSNGKWNENEKWDKPATGRVRCGDAFIQLLSGFCVCAFTNNSFVA